MRIVAVADTHHNTALLRQSVRQAIADGPIDAFIHCGDGVEDLFAAEAELVSANPQIRICAVRGNCDLNNSKFPVSELLALGGVRIFVTHGHVQQVKHGLGKFAKAARELKAGLAFFGHTHRAAVVRKHGVVLINPGSLASWSVTNTAYLEVRIDENQNIHEKFIDQRLIKD